MFKFAVQKMIEATDAALAKGALDQERRHVSDPASSQQTHHRCGGAISRLPDDKVVVNIARVWKYLGRFDSDRALRVGSCGTAEARRLIVFVAFGGGLSWGAVAWRWAAR